MHESLAELDARESRCAGPARGWSSGASEVAVEKRQSFADEPYWGRPIAGWGDERPEVLVVGLAPAANGGNRTGRMFTGDRSGDWLFAALHRVGLAAQATSAHAGDGQRLIGTRMVAAVRCAPPANKPTPDERDTCAPWLDAELALVLPSRARRSSASGRSAGTRVLRALGRLGLDVPRPRPRFGHGGRGRRPGPTVAGWSCSAATTRASRTPSPASSPSRCSTPSSAAAAAARPRVSCVDVTQNRL